MQGSQIVQWDVLKRGKRKYDARDLGKGVGGGGAAPCLFPASARFSQFLLIPFY